MQQEFSGSYLVTVGYVGSRDNHLFRQYQANPARPGTGAVDARRIYAPAFGPVTTFASVGNSTYHSAQLSLNKRFTNGFTLLSSYTFSKFIDDASADGEDAVAPFNLAGDKSVSDLDVPHRFVASFVYDLPMLQNSNRVVRWLLGGYQINGIVQVQSGTPFSILSGVDNSQSGINLDRADLVGDPRLAGDRSHGDLVAQYFNAGAFQVNAPRTFGTAGRNILRGPGFSNVDFGLFKNFPGFRESHQIQFRSEIFNLFNHANFANPGTNVSSLSTFGRITNTVGDPRVIQFALKYNF